MENGKSMMVLNYTGSINLENMVEIFKTSVNSKKQANKVLKTLSARLPSYCFNFDLDDCDRILRAQSSHIPIETTTIIQVVKDQDIKISLFED